MKKKDILIFILVLIVLTSFFSLPFILINQGEKAKYDLLKEEGHDVAYIKNGLLYQCAYRKSYGIRDCDFEYNDAVWEKKFANSGDAE